MVAIIRVLQYNMDCELWWDKAYCDMKPESQNSPLLDNGSLIHILWRCGFVETELVWNALSISTESTDNFHGYAQATFSMDVC
jgi:hypothetical protein